MSCGRTSLLDGLVRGETSAAVELDLRAHAKRCARCRHELNWLETEKNLFRQRAGRDEVSHLWRGVAKRSGLETPRRLPSLFAALTAAAVVVLGLSRLAAPHSVEGADASVVMQSEPLESTIDERACSTLPSGLGFHCGPAIPASILASR